MILKTLHGNLNLPAFFPDATYGGVIGVSSRDLKEAKVDGVVVNVYHLLRKNFIDKIEKVGGIHKFIKFDKPIISDSGGFQVMSLIHDHPELGKIERDKIVFKLNEEKITLTPEKCIQLQLKLKSDIVMCLDDCTRPDINLEEQEKSVDRTIRWARKCKQEFENCKYKNKPLIFAIIQGGENRKLREYCAKELIKIGFDGYSFGGWPIKQGNLLKDILKFTVELMPKDKPKYAMGIGKPQDIVECVKLGYDMFDCVLPTRDARHKRLYVFKSWKKFDNVNLRAKYKNNKNQISKFCDCFCCRNYSLADLYNFFKTDYNLAIKLATIHNLRFYSQLMEKLRRENKQKAL